MSDAQPTSDFGAQPVLQGGSESIWQRPGKVSLLSPTAQDGPQPLASSSEEEGTPPPTITLPCQLATGMVPGAEVPTVKGGLRAQRALRLES